jgi:hypothetical protein
MEFFQVLGKMKWGCIKLISHKPGAKGKRAEGKFPPARLKKVYIRVFFYHPIP